MTERKALIVMAKRPYPGRTKTRLGSLFSAQDAADLYACFLRDALDQARAVPQAQPFAAYAPVDPETRDYFAELAPDFALIAQEGQSLGERLDHVLSECLNMGYHHVAAMNSDSPTLPLAYLRLSFERLEDPGTDVVLGPCEDGGYYLIGWKKACSPLVLDVEMSTDHVLDDTLRIAEAENLRVSLLPTWYDVDDLDDLSRVWHELRQENFPTSSTGQYLSTKPLLLDSVLAARR